MFFDRYWSHIHDFGDFIKRVFIIFRCPRFQNWQNMKSIYAKMKRNKDVPIYFLIFVEAFWYNKTINKGSQGFKKPEIMEMLGLGPSHNKTEILLDQNEAE